MSNKKFRGDATGNNIEVSKKVVYETYDPEVDNIDTFEKKQA